MRRARATASAKRGVEAAPVFLEPAIRFDDLAFENSVQERVKCRAVIKVYQMRDLVRDD